MYLKKQVDLMNGQRSIFVIVPDVWCENNYE